MISVDSISINGQFIRINEKINIDLKCKIHASLIWNNLIFVILDAREYKIANENVQCFSFDGKLNWTIEAGNWPENKSCPVTGIWTIEGKLMVYRSCGFEQEIDPLTGKELSMEFTK